MSLSRQTKRQWLLRDTDSYGCATACSVSLENLNNRARALVVFHYWISQERIWMERLAFVRRSQ